jgi:hypothetical protein
VLHGRDIRHVEKCRTGRIALQGPLVGSVRVPLPLQSLEICARVMGTSSGPTGMREQLAIHLPLSGLD